MALTKGQVDRHPAKAGKKKKINMQKARMGNPLSRGEMDLKTAGRRFSNRGVCCKGQEPEYDYSFDQGSGEHTPDFRKPRFARFLNSVPSREGIYRYPLNFVALLHAI